VITGDFNAAAACLKFKEKKKHVTKICLIVEYRNAYSSIGFNDFFQ
jgi:hypothetical protein